MHAVVTDHDQFVAAVLSFSCTPKGVVCRVLNGLQSEWRVGLIALIELSRLPAHVLNAVLSARSACAVTSEAPCTPGKTARPATPPLVGATPPTRSCGTARKDRTSGELVFVDSILHRHEDDESADVSV